MYSEQQQHTSNQTVDYHDSSNKHFRNRREFLELIDEIKMFKREKQNALKRRNKQANKLVENNGKCENVNEVNDYRMSNQKSNGLNYIKTFLFLFN